MIERRGKGKVTSGRLTAGLFEDCLSVEGVDATSACVDSAGARARFNGVASAFFFDDFNVMTPFFTGL